VYNQHTYEVNCALDAVKLQEPCILTERTSNSVPNVHGWLGIRFVLLLGPGLYAFHYIIETTLIIHEIIDNYPLELE